MHHASPSAAAPSLPIIFLSEESQPLRLAPGDNRFPNSGAALPLGAQDGRRWLPIQSPRPVTATIALDAFPDMPPRRLQDLSNADFWDAKAREHITTLCAAYLLHKQVTGGYPVARSLSYALNAMQVEIGNRIQVAIRRHVSNGGQREAELRKVWAEAA